MSPDDVTPPAAPEDAPPPAPPPPPSKFDVRLTGDRTIAAIGDGARNIINLIDEKLLHRVQRSVLIGFGLLLVLLLGGGFLLARQLARPASMTGGFRIAVAGFEELGAVDAGLGREIALQIQQVMQSNLADTSLTASGLKNQITVWGPDDGGWQRVGTISGADSAARSRAAADLAQRIHADMIVYGQIDGSQPQWQARPEFYIASERFFEAQEITGEFELGAHISLPDHYGLLGRSELDVQINARSQALAHIVVGLSYYGAHNYERAYQSFQAADGVPGWRPEQGKQVLYLLLGNAASLDYQHRLTRGEPAEPELLAGAQAHYTQALERDPQYARALLALADIEYLNSMALYQHSHSPADIDVYALDRCLLYIEQALQAPVQPTQTEIELKAAFKRGTCYLGNVLANDPAYFGPAADQFRLVTAAFDARSDPAGRLRIQELAAEAHARLGLLLDLAGDPAAAAQAYQTAADLSAAIDPARSQYFLDRAGSLNSAGAP